MSKGVKKYNTIKMDTIFQCEKCNKQYKNKYTLKTHVSKNNCSKNTLPSIEFVCEGCNELFDRKYNFERHLTSCIIYIKIEKHRQTHEKVLSELRQENDKLRQENSKLTQDSDKLRQEICTEYDTKLKMKEELHESQLSMLNKQIESLNKMIMSTLHDSINKPTLTQNHNHNNNHTQNISFRDCLSKEHTVDQLSEKNMVERLRISMTEQMFYGGLRDIARLCYDCIIKLKDGKMILCCTDVSRNKFKMYDLYGNIKEDIEARYFTDKVGKCIKVAGTEIYNCIVESIQDEQSMLTEMDYKRKEELLDKYKRTCDAYIEIINVDDPFRNSDFINELAALTATNAMTKPLNPNTKPIGILL